MNNTEIIRGDVCAGIVLYNPDIKRLIQVLNSIRNQVPQVLLFDNGSENIDNILQVTLNSGNVTIIKSDTNVGIATALNRLCSHALELGFKWCLTLDHDTICNEKMIGLFAPYIDEESIGILCPNVIYEGMEINKKVGQEDVEEVTACMTSGSLTNLEAWKKIGGFKDGYFIDFVDNEYCMKLRLEGYKICRVNTCVINHLLGEAISINILNIYHKSGSAHSPWRYYYMTRNNLMFIWDYRKHLNVFKEYLKIVQTLYYGVIYSTNRKETLKYIRLGIIDAYKRKEGPMQLDLRKPETGIK